MPIIVTSWGNKLTIISLSRASDFFQDWWAKVIHGAKNGASFSER